MLTGRKKFSLNVQIIVLKLSPARPGRPGVGIGPG